MVVTNVTLGHAHTWRMGMSIHVGRLCAWRREGGSHVFTGFYSFDLRTSSEQNKFCRIASTIGHRRARETRGKKLAEKPHSHAEFLPTSIRAKRERSRAWNPSQIHVEFTIPSGGARTRHGGGERWRHRWSMPRSTPRPPRSRYHAPPRRPPLTPADPSTLRAADRPLVRATDLTIPATLVVVSRSQVRGGVRGGWCAVSDRPHWLAPSPPGTPAVGKGRREREAIGREKGGKVILVEPAINNLYHM